MKVAFKKRSSIAAFMVLSGLVAFAASPEVRLSTYKNQVRGRDSGVYEVDGDLYVHVRMPQKSSANMNNAKLKAALEANGLLKKWAIEHTAPQRDKIESSSEGVKLAARVADSCNSGWRFNDWNLKFKGQELSGQETGVVLFGQMMSKAEIVRQIPPSFYKAIPHDVLFKVLGPFVKAMRERDASRLYGLCNAIDLMPDAAVTPKAKEEFARVNVELDKYLTSSEFVAGLKEHAKKIRGPMVAENWVDVLQKPAEEVSNSVVIVTNVIAEVRIATNVVTRAQSDKERMSTGFVAKGEVKETTRISDEEEVVETRTATTVTTIRKIRRKTVKEVSGCPVFEEAFLSGGKVLDKASVQTEIGKKAVAIYFDNVTPMDEKTKKVADALCENPGDSQLWNLYGRCLLQARDNMAALVCFRCAVKLDASNQYAIANISMVYDFLGCAELARGMAILAYGLAQDEWCRNVAKNILYK